MTIHEDSLLARIYGIYSIEMEGKSPVYLFLMGNCGRSIGIKREITNDYVKCKFDLKGSLIKREVKFKDNEQPKHTDILKDINLQKMKRKEGEESFLMFS